MSNEKNKTFLRLGIIAGVILLALVAGMVFGIMDTILNLLSTIGLVLLGITILVTIHELGHFLAAKAFGMRVEAFSIGFPPKLFSFKRGETEYQVGATPLGGYVKISGIIDESLDTDHLNSEPAPYEFRAKPVWQRLIVMTAGVIMNVILAIGIFIGLKYAYPDVRLPMSEVKYGIDVSPYGNTLGNILGFQTGDSLVSFKGEQYEYFEDYQAQKNLVDDGAYYEVMRNGQVVKLPVPGNVQNYFNHDSISPRLFTPDMPAVIDVVDSLTDAETGKTLGALPAHKAGLKSGDQVIMIDSMPVRLFSDLRDALAGKELQPVEVLALRGGDTLSFQFATDSSGKMGVNPMLLDYFVWDTIHYSFGEAVALGPKEAFTVLMTNIRGLRNMFRKDVDASKSVMGPIQIATTYRRATQNGGLRGFLSLTAILSMVLAFVNILPIPALDGGHVVFLLIEGITRKEPSVKVRIIAQQIGMVFLLGLMLLIIFNDFFQVAS